MPPVGKGEADIVLLRQSEAVTPAGCLHGKTLTGYLKGRVLTSVPLGVTTWIAPVVAPVGTVVVSGRPKPR